jgi:hypothetical protein
MRISGLCGVTGEIGTGGQVVEKGGRAGNLRTTRAEFGSLGSCCDSHCGDRRREGEFVVLGRNAAGQQRRQVSRGGRGYRSVKTRGERLEYNVVEVISGFLTIIERGRTI